MFWEDWREYREVSSNLVNREDLTSQNKLSGGVHRQQQQVLEMTKKNPPFPSFLPSFLPSSKGFLAERL